MTFRALANLEAVFKSELQDPQAAERPDDLKLAEGRIRDRQALQVEGLAVSQVQFVSRPTLVKKSSRGPRRQRTSGEEKDFQSADHEDKDQN